MQLGELLAGLLGAVVGAIVGGAATLFASLIVERKKVARETRIRMYGELLPAVVDGFIGYSGSRIRQESTLASQEYERRLRELERASVIAGRKDHALTRELIDVLIARELAAHQGTTRSEPDSDLLSIAPFLDYDVFDRKARRLQAYLADKIR